MGIRIIGAGNTTEAKVSTLLGAVATEPRPMQVAGAFAASATSGTVGAGASADSIVFSFRNPSTTYLARVKRFGFSVNTLGTGFTAGVGIFYVKVVRGFTAADTTGGTALTLTGDNAALRTSLATSMCAAYIANTGAITAGTGNADTTAIKRRSFTFPTTVQAVVADDPEVIVARPGDYPLVLAQDEGFRLYATVPATGTWVLNVNVEWDEIAATEYTG